MTFTELVLNEVWRARREVCEYCEGRCLVAAPNNLPEHFRFDEVLASTDDNRADYGQPMTESSRCWFCGSKETGALLAYKETPDKPFLPACEKCAEVWGTEFVSHPLDDCPKCGKPIDKPWVVFHGPKADTYCSEKCAT